MNKSRLLAASAAFAMVLGAFPSIQTSQSGAVELTSMTSKAYADEGRKGKRFWVRASSMEEGVSQIMDIIVRGDEACFGSPRNHTCYGFNPLMREVRLQEVNRPIGANKNHSVTTIVALDTGMAVQRTEAGVVLARFQVGSEQMNGTAMLIQGLTAMLPAFANGLGSSALCTIAGCGNSGGGPSAIAISDSAAQSIANTLIQGVGGVGSCGSGPCPVARNDN